jgi:methionyl-tRNA formyltransferase
MSNLRIAYAGHNFFTPCLKAILDNRAVELVLCLTHPADDDNKYFRQLVEAANVPLIEGRLTDASIATFNTSQIYLLISAAYYYKLPVDRLNVQYAVNVHPSLLPAGRGPNPLPYYVDEHPDYCGVSIHELTSVMDGGPLLIQEKIEVRNGESIDELYLKIAAAAPRLLNSLIYDIQNLFIHKKTQRQGSYWPDHTSEQRTIVARSARSSDVVRIHRKFGMFGILLQLQDGSVIEGTRVTAKECSHDFAAGTVIGGVKGAHIVALQDGLMTIGI